MITRPVHVIPTAEECAAEFAGAGSDWQAKFLNALAGHPFWVNQLAWLAGEPGLSNEARGLMDMIGRYAFATGINAQALAAEGRDLAKDLERRIKTMVPTL